MDFFLDLGQYGPTVHCWDEFMWPDVGDGGGDELQRVPPTVHKRNTDRMTSGLSSQYPGVHGAATTENRRTRLSSSGSAG